MVDPINEETATSMWVNRHAGKKSVRVHSIRASCTTVCKTATQNSTRVRSTPAERARWRLAGKFAFLFAPLLDGVRSRPGQSSSRGAARGQYDPSVVRRCSPSLGSFYCRYTGVLGTASRSGRNSGLQLQVCSTPMNAIVVPAWWNNS